jgi:hypothetical protein
LGNIEFIGQIITKAAEGGTTPGQPGRPSPADLVKIRPFMLTDPDPAGLYVRRLIVANDAPDRDFEQFPPAILARIAQTLPGKSLLINHNKEQLATGLFFDAQLRKAQGDEEGQNVVEAAFYLAANAENQNLRQQIDAGVVRYASVSSTWDSRECSACGSDYTDCRHIKGETGANGQPVVARYAGDPAKYEAKEGSLVYLGAQRGARLYKSAKDQPNMDELQKLVLAVNDLKKAFDDRLTALEAKTPPPPPATDPDPKAKTAPETLNKALEEDGKQYREALRKDIARLAEITKSADEANLLLSAMPEAPATALLPIRDNYQKKADALFPPQPSGHLEPYRPEGSAPQNPAQRVSLF